MAQTGTLDQLIDKYNQASQEPLEQALSMLPRDPENRHANLVYARLMAKAFPRHADVTGTGAIGVGDRRMIDFFKRRAYSAITDKERSRMFLIRGEIEKTWLTPRLLEKFDRWPPVPKHTDPDFADAFHKALEDTYCSTYLDDRGMLRTYQSELSQREEPKKSWLKRVREGLKPSVFGGV